MMGDQIETVMTKVEAGTEIGNLNWRRVAMVRVLRVCHLVSYRVLKVVEKFEKKPLLFRPVPLADEPLQVVSV